MKKFQITSAQIEVSANPHVATGMIANFEVTGILPGCQKNVEITTTVVYMAIVCWPRFVYNGSASIHPEDWRKLINEAPVVSSKFLPVLITPAVEAWAREQALSVCDCPAVRSEKDVPPAYKASQTWDEIVRRATALPVSK